MCSVAQSSSVTGTRLGPQRAHALVGVDRDAGCLEPVEHRRQQPFGGVAVHEQRLEGVADARPLHLRVVHELDRPVLARALVEEHVHDAGARSR